MDAISFGGRLLIGSAVAFAFAWFTRKKESAYMRGFLGSLFVVLVPGCVPMYQSNPVSANRAAEEFFWTFIPLLVSWMFCAAVAIGFARIFRWKE
jgi:hypothetical protein